jgi:hypothetical protein
MVDETEDLRRARMAELAAEAGTRADLEARYGRVWTTDEMTADFEAIGFLAPYVVVRNRATGEKGTLEFQGRPRFYFSWKLDTKA